MKILTILFIVAVFALNVFAQDWRKMTDDELQKSVPEKAAVIKENIETELRTASGITDGKNQFFGVLIITAGYAADGTYTHFLKTDSKIKIGDLSFGKGEYVFGYKRIDQENLRVKFSNAKDGKEIGSVKAKFEPAKGAIYSFLIVPPVAKKGKIYIGRFTLEYNLD